MNSKLKYSIVLLVFMSCLFSLDAMAKKKRKKRCKTSSSRKITKAPKNNTVADSVRIVRAPGVPDQHSLDSIKAEKMKEKLKYIKDQSQK